MQQAVSPYDVPVHTVAPALELTVEPLVRFEQDQLERLINQFNHTPDRVRNAFLAHLREHSA